MKSRRIQVIFNSTQLSLANKHAGVARYAFNWGLAECNNALENHKRRPSAYDLQKRYVAEVKSKNPWCYDVSSSSQDRAMVQVDAAFIKHFHKEGGSPRFKKKENVIRFI
ncbi:MAG: helix-turn-helix domain-containing protein [Bacteroidota bacterium]|nr:helix-turn-helix domain-containing protein [Bacteroidota bacterium]